MPRLAEGGDHRDPQDEIPQPVRTTDGDFHLCLFVFSWLCPS
jgi:hypothetical protein